MSNHLREPKGRKHADRPAGLTATALSQMIAGAQDRT